MPEINKETVVDLIGTTEGFSAEALKEQLNLRAKAVIELLARFRKENSVAAVKDKV